MGFVAILFPTTKCASGRSLCTGSHSYGANAVFHRTWFLRKHNLLVEQYHPIILPTSSEACFSNQEMQEIKIHCTMSVKGEHVNGFAIKTDKKYVKVFLSFEVCSGLLTLVWAATIFLKRFDWMFCSNCTESITFMVHYDAAYLGMISKLVINAFL